MNRTKGRYALAIMVGLGVLSFVIYSLFFSWGFAVLLIGSLVFHEYGHIWAMQRCGMKVSGIYLIPFVGGAAVSKGKVSSQAATVFIYLAGPAFGLALAAVTACAYLLTGWTVLAGAACWMAILNLLNLAPIFPLDGGGVLRAIAYSVHPVIGGILQGISALLAFLLVFFGGHWIFWIIGFFAWREGLDYIGARPGRGKLLAFLSTQRKELMETWLSKKRRFHLSLLLQGLRGKGLLEADLRIPSHGSLLRDVVVMEDTLKEPPPCSGRGICYSIGGYLLIVVALLILLVTTGMVSGSLESLLALTGQQ